MAWNDSDPGVGDSSGASATGSALYRESTELLSTLSSIAGVVSGSESRWKGGAADAWRSQVTVVHGNIDTRSKATETIATAITTFATALERIIADTATAKAAKAAAVAGYEEKKRREDLANTLTFTGGQSLTVSPFGSGLGTLASYPGYSAAVARIQELADERRAAERTCIDSINAALPASWSALRSLGASLGVDPATLTPAQIAAQFEENSHEAIDTYLTELTPAEAAAFWPLLTQATKDRLIEENSAVVGNLEGIPYGDRHQANIRALEAQYTALKAERDRLETSLRLPNSDAGHTMVSSELARLTSSMSEVQKLYDKFVQFDGLAQDPPQYLVSYSYDTNFGSEGVLASVGVGNLDTATSIAVLVPGMNSSAAEPEGYIRGAQNIIEDRQDQAVLVFLGYQSPDAATVMSDSRAEAGGRHLVESIQGLTTVRGDDARLNVIAHSYGTTTTAYALMGGKISVDSVTFLSSAGIPKDAHVDNLGVPANRVFVTEPEADDIANFGRVGGGFTRQDPETDDFGAVRFGSDGTTLPDGTVLEAVTGHGASPGSEEGAAHLDGNSETMHNVQQIMDGKYSSLTDGNNEDVNGTWWEQGLIAHGNGAQYANPYYQSQVER